MEIANSKMIYLRLIIRKQNTFKFEIATDNNDKSLNMYSLSRNMMLNIPKFQSSFTLFTTVCIV